MLENLKGQLYLHRKQILLDKGYKEGKIVYFDDELYSKMNNAFCYCIPVSMYIKYLKPLDGMLGKCFDRSIYMFFCFDDALFVCGDSKDLEVRYGKRLSRHGWVEMGDYVYDPSMLLRFEKDLYYKIYMPKNITKLSKEQYCSSEDSIELYNDVRNTSIEDFRPHGKKRLELFNKMPLLKSAAEMLGRDDFIRDLYEYLELIQYDEEQLLEEFNSKIEQVCKTKMAKK